MTAPYLADATDPRFTDGQRAHLARFEAAPAAPESFDPIAALRRVEALADYLANWQIKALVEGSSYPLETPEQIRLVGRAGAFGICAHRIRVALNPQGER